MKSNIIKKKFKELTEQARKIETRTNNSIIDFIITFDHQMIYTNNMYLYYRES